MDSTNTIMTETRLIAFGCGYVATALAGRLAARGVPATGTTRTSEGAAVLATSGIEPAIWPDQTFTPTPGAAWLISVPPNAEGCPVWAAFGDLASTAGWIGYLSTTGVYGDLGGRWAFEDTPRNPQSREAANRAIAEDQWLGAGAHLFRLPGIYGPGRSQLDRVREPGARRIVKSGQVFSRAHRDDIASALDASLTHPQPGSIYNVCDDEPAPADIVLSFAAKLLKIPAPPEVAFTEAGLSPAAQRFYAECKRVSNARAKAALDWRPRYPTYREGLAACLAAEAST
jgi:hypothetical protein